MKRSYFIPLVLLATILILLGLTGVYAMSLAEQFLGDRKPEMSMWIPLMRREAIWAGLLGLVVGIWAFERRKACSRSRVEQEGKGSRVAICLRSVVFVVLLLALTAGIFLQLRLPALTWVHYVGMRPGIEQLVRIRSTLTRRGLPFRYVELDSKGGQRISVCIEGPAVVDVNAISGLPIHYLVLRDTQVTDLTPVKTCPISSLILSKTPVGDISALSGTSIAMVDLRETGLMDLRPLTQMPNLKEVKLSREQIMGNLDTLSSLDILVQIVDGGPAWNTTGSGWRQEFKQRSEGKP